jgi:hypothetical protein
MRRTPTSGFLSIGLAMIIGAAASSPSQAKPSAQQTAQQVDRLLAEEVFSGETTLAPRVSDATFLRRAWLDIVGDIPTPEHVTAFLLDPSADNTGATSSCCAAWKTGPRSFPTRWLWR